MKKTQLIYLLISFIPSFLFSGCRMNNGDIGSLFGSWLLYSMTVDGETPSDFSDDSTFWEFQNDIVFITTVDSHYQKANRVGSWSEIDNRLYLDFTHTMGDNPPGTGINQAPEWLYMPPCTVIPLYIISSSSDRMTLSYSDDEGQTVVYNLRKIW